MLDCLSLKHFQLSPVSKFNFYCFELVLKTNVWGSLYEKAGDVFRWHNGPQGLILSSSSLDWFGL